MWSSDPVSIEDLILKGGSSLDGSCVVNDGNLYLSGVQCLLTKTTEPPSTVVNSENGTITIQGQKTTTVK